MMNLRVSARAAAIIILFGLMGCRAGAPIYDIKSTAIPNSIDGSMPLADVTKSITAAAAKHGWEMRVEKPGYIIATRHLREHEAVVDIMYDTKAYSILYRSSQNL